MKLVISVVSNKDINALLDELMLKEYRATKLSSTGGFLKEGNTTLITGVEDSKVDDIMGIIGRVCRSRKQLVAPIYSGLTESFVPYPMEVLVGGATVFVIDVERSYKV